MFLFTLIFHASNTTLDSPGFCANHVINCLFAAFKAAHWFPVSPVKHGAFFFFFLIWRLSVQIFFEAKEGQGKL